MMVVKYLCPVFVAKTKDTLNALEEMIVEAFTSKVTIYGDHLYDIKFIETRFLRETDF